MLFIIVNGEWKTSKASDMVIDPMNGEEFLKMPSTQSSELQPFIDSMQDCPRYGLHNPLHQVDRYFLILHLYIKKS